MSTKLLATPGVSLNGNISVPGDKSISHRAVILAAIAQGTSRIDNFLAADDTLATISAFRAMGVTIINTAPDQLEIHGVGKHGLTAAHTIIDCGNSGTTLRLLSGLLAAQPFTTQLSGDASLCKRPMQRIITPLTFMGAAVAATQHNFAPLTITPVPQLQGIDYRLPIASAQVKSALLLAGLYAQGATAISEPQPTRDHTERLLKTFNYPLAIHGRRITITNEGILSAAAIHIPNDISSAAFFIVGACIAPGSDILLPQIGVNPSRTGILEILQRMGADISISNQREMCHEPVADIRVRYKKLRGITVPKALIPAAIDELPILFIAAANAIGETIITDAQELRVKESDRLQVMAEGLQILGVKIKTLEDGLIIQGSPYNGGIIQSYRDHRIAMAFAMAALTAHTPITIHDWQSVATSFPDFIEISRQCGLQGYQII